MGPNVAGTNTQSGSRDLTLDVAKGLGLVVVYFGHMLEKFVPLFSVAGFAQTAVFLTWKVVYSFHMALFFIISGIQIGRSNKSRPMTSGGASLGSGVRKLFGNLLLRRLLPYVVFSAIGVTLNGLLGLWPEQNGQKGLEFYPGHYLDMFSGVVQPWTVQWFLISIGVIEFALWLPRRFGWLTHRKGVLIAAISLLAVSMWWLSYPRATVPFYFHPASLGVTTSLTLLGVCGSQWFARPGGLKRLPVAIAAASICFVSALANVGEWTLMPPNIEQILGNRFAILFVLGWYGNPLWFVLSALSGSLFAMIVAREMAKLRLGLGLAAVGREGLILFLVNGFFLAFANGPIAANLAPAAGVNSAPALVFVSLVIAIGELSLAWIVVVWWKRLRGLLLT